MEETEDFLAALATWSVSATLDFGRNEKLQTFDRSDVKTKRQKDKKAKRWKDRNTKRLKDEKIYKEIKKGVSCCDVREVSHCCNVFSFLIDFFGGRGGGEARYSPKGK